MSFELYRDVVVPRDMDDVGLHAGDVGTVVERHDIRGVEEEGYSVEFFDMTGNTVALVYPSRQRLRGPTRQDRPAARALTA